MILQRFSSGAVDDGIATATVIATAGTCYIARIWAGFSTDPAAPKRMTTEVDGATLDGGVTIKTGGPADLGVGGLWGPLTSTTSGVKVKLPASGTAGVTGEVCVFAYVLASGEQRLDGHSG